MKKLIIFLLFPLAINAQHNFTNIVLEGGGIRGLAYGGVIEILEQKQIIEGLQNVGGASAGAIAGLLLSLNFSAKEIDSIMFNLPVHQFNDGKGWLFGNYKRAKNKFGLYQGNKFFRWLQKLCEVKTGNANLTFAELHALHENNPYFKNLYCVGTNLSKQQVQIFSYKHTPNLPIALAVRISGGIPLYFEPIALDEAFNPVAKNDTITFKNYYVDGGMLANFPICLFDSCVDGANPLITSNVIFNKQTLGVKLETQQQIDSLQKNKTQIRPYYIKSIGDFVSAFVNLNMEGMNRRFPNLENERGRTIYVSDGNLSPRIRKLKLSERQLLYNNGRAGALLFFNNSF
jgi:NTE family protein